MPIVSHNFWSKSARKNHAEVISVEKTDTDFGILDVENIPVVLFFARYTAPYPPLPSFFSKKYSSLMLPSLD